MFTRVFVRVLIFLDRYILDTLLRAPRFMKLRLLIEDRAFAIARVVDRGYGKHNNN